VGSKNKLKRFKENEGFENVVQPKREILLNGEFSLKGKWGESFFNNDYPLVLELGCGKGEYTVNLAKKYPEKNFIGIDIKGARLWRGAKTGLEEQISNIGFLRTQIELIENCFAPKEVSEIWITFPDPQIKFKRTKHRLTNEEFLNKYRTILQPNGLIHLKTDSEFMHGYTLGLLHGLREEITYSNHDVYGTTGAPNVVTEIQTYYEQQYLDQNKKITYVSFKLASK